MTADIGGLSPASNQPDNQLVQQQRAQATQQRLQEQQLAARREEQSPPAEKADKATISNEAAGAAERAQQVPEREAASDNLQDVENRLDFARESVNQIRDMAREQRQSTSSVSEVAAKQQQVDRNLNDVSATEEAINARLEKQAQESGASSGYEFQKSQEMGRIVTGPSEADAQSSLTDLYSGGTASLQNNPQAAEDITTRVIEEMSNLQVGVNNVRSGLYSNMQPGGISALEGALGNSETAQQALNNVVGNLMNNNGALLESLSGNINGQRVFDLLS